MGTVTWINGSTPAQAQPADAVTRLRHHLAAAGAGRMYSGDRGTVAVLSVRAGLTVWCVAGMFRWRDESGATVTHPAADPEGAARRVLAVGRPQQARAAA